ncbi:hypothetical protein EOD39_13228 [Acipenser ruthenus]|uniref:Uncharacterized protein n=1 Tax=Acipenser ruthenus TaxID=7906 RepID=A0A444UJ47_ACIRT|nr:hypothetical protein EOD39_13228 [Acipenser ruthenus]
MEDGVRAGAAEGETSAWRKHDSERGSRTPLLEPGQSKEDQVEAATPSAASLASELERECRWAYAESSPAKQGEQARLQFIEVLGTGELHKHLRLQHSQTLHAALRLSQEWEEVMVKEASTRNQPAVRRA